MTDSPPPVGDHPGSPSDPGLPPPPPAGGGYPPPPPASGGYAPPLPGAAQYGGDGGYGGESAEGYTPWLTRVLAWLVDWLPVAILSGLGSLLLVTMQKVETVCVTDSSEYQLGDFCATGSSGPTGLAWTLFVLLEIVAVAYVFWNLGYKQGTTGSSIGKGILHFKIVGEDTGQPIGFGRSAARELIYLVAYGACGIVWLVAVLFPLWDARRQTLVDKLIKTVAVSR